MTALIGIRVPERADRLRLEQMLARCSPDTKRRRFHGCVRRFPEPYLTDVVERRPHHFALVATASDRVVALADCTTLPGGVGELAVVVEDAYQRLGLASRLVALLVERADRLDLQPLRATVLVEQAWILERLHRHGSCAWQVCSGVFDVAWQPVPRSATRSFRPVRSGTT